MPKSLKRGWFLVLAGLAAAVVIPSALEHLVGDEKAALPEVRPVPAASESQAMLQELRERPVDPPASQGTPAKAAYRLSPKAAAALRACVPALGESVASLDAAWSQIETGGGGRREGRIEVLNEHYLDEQGAQLRFHALAAEAPEGAAGGLETRLFAVDAEGLPIPRAWPEEAGLGAAERRRWLARGQRPIYSDLRERVLLDDGQEWIVEREGQRLRALRPLRSSLELLCDADLDQRLIECRCRTM